MAGSGQVQLAQRAYRFALAPTPAQERQLLSHAGAARVAFNWGLARIAEALAARRAEAADGGKATTKRPGHFDLCKAWTAHKDRHQTEPDERDRTYAWVGENFVGTYQAALRDADQAIRNFFDSRTNRRAGRAMGWPRFKSRRRTPPSFQMHGTSVRMIDQSHLNLPKIGPIKVPGKVRLPGWTDRNGRQARALCRVMRRAAVLCPPCAGSGEVERPPKTREGVVLEPARMVPCATCKGHRHAPAGRIIRASISRGASGIWWCSLTVEVALEIRTAPSKRQRSNGTIGLDLGTRYLAVDSEGTVYPNPQHLEQALLELRDAQRAFARTQRDSKRRDKARRRVGAIHERVKLMRKDSTDKLTTALARTFAGVAVEGYDVARLASTQSERVPARVRKRRNRQLADAAPGMVRWQLEYKTSWLGAAYFKAGAGLETGRTCSACGAVRDKPIPLATDMFDCDACGASLDRRVNTARVVRGGFDGVVGRGANPAPTEPRGGDVRPTTPRRGGRSPTKRAARSRSPDRRETGTSAPEGADIPS